MVSCCRTLNVCFICSINVFTWIRTVSCQRVYTIWFRSFYVKLVFLIKLYLTLQTDFAVRWCFWFSANDSAVEQVCPTPVYMFKFLSVYPSNSCLLYVLHYVSNTKISKNTKLFVFLQMYSTLLTHRNMFDLDMDKIAILSWKWKIFIYHVYLIWYHQT